MIELTCVDLYATPIEISKVFVIVQSIVYIENFKYHGVSDYTKVYLIGGKTITVTESGNRIKDLIYEELNGKKGVD